MEFLSALLTWQVGVSVLIAAVVISVVYFLGKSDYQANVKYVLQLIQSAESFIKAILPNQWKGIFEIILDIANDVADGILSQDEAKQLMRKVINEALEKMGSEITNTEKNAIYTICDYIINAIIVDKNAAVKALSMIN